MNDLIKIKSQERGYRDTTSYTVRWDISFYDRPNKPHLMGKVKEVMEEVCMRYFPGHRPSRLNIANSKSLRAYSRIENRLQPLPSKSNIMLTIRRYIICPTVPTVNYRYLNSCSCQRLCTKQVSSSTYFKNFLSFLYVIPHSIVFTDW
jgi:hypothetical protein